MALWYEGMSTVGAYNELHYQGVKATKSLIDSTAAAIVLQASLGFFFGLSDRLKEFLDHVLLEYQDMIPTADED